ncbi:hypothetical protein [Parvibaculum sp.]|uniref:Lactoylglutathione lyase and related lyases n=1 Tax=uncultured Rhizobiales bacterium HF4000_48A13 TaxID=710781 RepID=E0XZ39_9HYPH|nr:lactoylglutathione lyase and related lyases [uncultured Rhizobiales bacterium HF4000_48A13]
MTHCDAMDSECIEGRSWFVAETRRKFDEEREIARENRAAESRKSRLPSDFIDVEHGLVDRKIFTVFNARFIRAAIRDKLQEGAIAVEEATADLRKQRGVTLRSTLDRHTNDHMVSFYMATPSGFEVEFGTGARTVDDKDWSVVSREKISTWSHVPGA